MCDDNKLCDTFSNMVHKFHPWEEAHLGASIYAMDEIYR
jgi:hypothetical protein